MSAASCLQTEDQFLCSICLDVFTHPVTIPCGHNFCKACITDHWNVNAPPNCPNCKEGFNIRPELRVNTFISEMAGLKRHQLMDPVENLEGWMCTKHDKLLELFCKTDQMCVCMFCTVADHKNHDVVPLREEYEGKKAELGKTEAEVQQMIQKRRLKIQEIKHSVELSEKEADREVVEGVLVFSALKESVERSQAELINTIKGKQRKTQKQAEGFIKELEQEISELKKRSTEVEQLSRSEDPLHLLQSFRTLNTAPPTKDWTGVRMKKLLDEVELKRVQQSAVDVTLDPDTAHPQLILSDDGKQGKLGDVKKNLPDNPERFNSHPVVLGKQSFSSGRFYYEVQVKGKTAWVLGVVRESINRKGFISPSPQDGYWTIRLWNKNSYSACADPSVRLSLESRPEKVGVFVDYEEGLVSFYDVGAAALIYSFTDCCFTEKLYPYFSPSHDNKGTNSAPLIISAFN
uniref:Tripartite motif containing 39 n=1 Tax=Gasterosteus aculeatus TaxID=69293 RepID=G3P1Q6_GASAC